MVNNHQFLKSKLQEYIKAVLDSCATKQGGEP